MAQLEKTELQIGYIPLLDCLALLWAEHRGYFQEEQLQVSLVKESSWASLRDRLAFGFLDAAHCLSTMVAAASMSVDQLGVPFSTPLALSHNRAYISLSQKLCYDLGISAADTPQQSASKIVQAMQQGQGIQFAHVFKHSIHHYILREWLSLADPQLAQQLTFLTLPPPCMVEAIAQQTVDGFCVGDPWNTQAEIEGYSRIIANSQDIIPAHIPDKVLAVSQEWAIQHPQSLQAMHRAIQKAQHDLACTASDYEIWQLLLDNQIIQFNCNERIHVDVYHKILSIVRDINHEPHLRTVDFLWIMEQMKRWDQLPVEQAYIQLQSSQCIIA